MQRLKVYFLTAVLTATCLISARAQEPSQIDESSKNRREIGFGTNIILGPIFDGGNASSPLHLMYRWGDDKRLFRLGTALTYSSSTSYYNDLQSFNQQNYVRAELFLGREWRAEVAKRWLVNFGGDVNFNYGLSRSRTEHTYDELEESIRVSVNKGDTESLGAGLRPFVGIIFRINDRLLLGTEASFLAGARKNYVSSERYTLINGERSDEYVNDDDSRSTWSFQVRTQPASNIFVYYRF